VWKTQGTATRAPDIKAYGAEKGQQGPRGMTQKNKTKGGGQKVGPLLQQAQTSEKDLSGGPNMRSLHQQKGQIKKKKGGGKRKGEEKEKKT